MNTNDFKRNALLNRTCVALTVELEKAKNEYTSLITNGEDDLNLLMTQSKYMEELEQLIQRTEMTKKKPKMKKTVKERIKQQVKTLPREELEKRYLNLLFQTYNTNGKRSGLLGSMIAEKKKKTNANSNRKKQYYQDLEHPKWLEKRKIILERDNHQCVLCGKDSNLQVHHTKYHNGKRAWEYPNSTLVTLCRECHEKVHQDKTHQLYPQFIEE